MVVPVRLFMKADYSTGREVFLSRLVGLVGMLHWGLFSSLKNLPDLSLYKAIICEKD